MNITRTVIPAEPGWKVIHWLNPDECDGDGKGKFYYETVLAWIVVVDADEESTICASTLPVTADSTCFYEVKEFALVSPDGRVLEQNGVDYDTVGSYYDYMMDDWKKDNESDENTAPTA